MEKKTIILYSGMISKFPNVHFTTGNSQFAECKGVCRVQSFEHSTKKLFTECCSKNTRQNSCTRQKRGFAECEKKTLGKERGLPSAKKILGKEGGLLSAKKTLGKEDGLPSAKKTLGKEIVCRVSKNNWQTPFFAECFFCTRQTPLFTECFSHNTRQRACLSSARKIALGKPPCTRQIDYFR